MLKTIFIFRIWIPSLHSWMGATTMGLFALQMVKNVHTFIIEMSRSGYFGTFYYWNVQITRGLNIYSSIQYDNQIGKKCSHLGHFIDWNVPNRTFWDIYLLNCPDRDILIIKHLGMHVLLRWKKTANKPFFCIENNHYFFSVAVCGRIF